jgi:hypothetical protein
LSPPHAAVFAHLLASTRQSTLSISQSPNAMQCIQHINISSIHSYSSRLFSTFKFFHPSSQSQLNLSIPFPSNSFRHSIFIHHFHTPIIRIHFAIEGSLNLATYNPPLLHYFLLPNHAVFKKDFHIKNFLNIFQSVQTKLVCVVQQDEVKREICETK